MQEIWQTLIRTTTVSGLTWLFANINPLPAQAVAPGLSLNATVTADNHYGLYVGNQNGSRLVFVGRNEKGPFHIPDTDPPVPDEACLLEQGPFNWACPEAFATEKISPRVIYQRGTQFFVNIYTVVWDDDAIDSALLGEFNLLECDCEGQIINSISFQTDGTWEYFFSDIPNPGTFGNVPSMGILRNEIADANTNNEWLPAIPLGANDGSTLPWRRIPAIDSSAQFLNALTFGNANAYIFRKTVEVSDIPPCIPEPSMNFGLLTIGIGLYLRQKFLNSKRGNSVKLQDDYQFL